MRAHARLLYVVLMVGCATGYAWVAWTVHDPVSESTVCLLKNTTGFPCPSCGSTRAVAALARGDAFEALQWNPLGFLIAAVLLVAPIWIVYDFVTKQQTLVTFAERTERILQRRWVAIPAIALVLVNWIWNFSKNL